MFSLCKLPSGRLVFGRRERDGKRVARLARELCERARSSVASVPPDIKLSYKLASSCSLSVEL